MGVTRLIATGDAPVLAGLLRANHEFLAPWMPVRAGTYFTAAGQRRIVQEALAHHAQGVLFPHVILADDAVVGRVTISNVVRGAFQSGNVGYWLDERHTGRGLATAAVAEIMRLAFEELGLHRIEAGALPHNTRSQRVLERNGFERIGLAPAYLRIAGQWQDHALYQAIRPD